nr:(2Fe-2S)-binding protein [Amycolatopsis arida]
MAGLQQRAEIRADLPIGGGSGAGRWLRCADLLDDPTLLDEWRARLAEWLRAEFGRAPARTTASYVMSWYLRVPAYAGALLLHHERRVPMLRPAELAVRTAAEGRPDPDGVTVLGRSFYCLPSDPGSARPEATVVADERALAEVLRARYVAHVSRFVAVYRRISPLGARTLWAGATDALDSCLWWAGAQGGTAESEGAGVADATLVLESRFAPLTSASTLRTTLDEHGRRVWTRRRESCCFSYLLPGADECAGCPRTRPRP